MAIDQSSLTSTPDHSQPAIENEFPTYRAISSLAVLSVVLGLASVFCYADHWFLLLSASAVAAGLISIRKIRRLPEVLTGAAFARVGIGLGLLFGLSSITRTVMQDFMINQDAGQFAKHYIEILKDQPISVALWYQQAPEFRSKKTPDEIMEEVKKSKSPASGDPFIEKTMGMQKIKERLKAQGEELRFSQIESRAISGLTTYANALLKIAGPGSKEYPKEQYALLQMIKGPSANPYDWIVQEVRFPYTPQSLVAVAQKADDGHGHGH